MLAALASLWLGAVAPPTLAYERYVQPTPQSVAARTLNQEVRRWAHRRVAPIDVDWRLVRAASRMCEALSDNAELPAQSALVAAALHEGSTDAELTAIALSGPPSEHPALLAQQLQQEPEELEPTHFGLAQCSKGEGQAMRTLVLMSRRLVQLTPTAAWRAPKHPLHLLGQIAAPGVRRVLLAVIRSDGSVARPEALALTGGAFVTDVALGQASGTARVQLLVERGRGPEVAAEFPVEVGHPAHRTTPAGGLRAHRAPNSGAHLLALIFGLRKSHALALPEPHTPLTLVAREHCEDMQRAHYFAHVSRTSGSVVERLRRHNQAYLHVVENLAEARDVEDMFAGWVESPAHLANLLDTHVDHFGLAVCSDPRGLTPAKAVLVMAQLRAPGPREALLPGRADGAAPGAPALPAASRTAH